jgi:hypothetical protein
MKQNYCHKGSLEPRVVWCALGPYLAVDPVRPVCARCMVRTGAKVEGASTPGDASEVSVRSVGVPTEKAAIYYTVTDVTRRLIRAFPRACARNIGFRFSYHICHSRIVQCSAGSVSG